MIRWLALGLAALFLTAAPAFAYPPEEEAVTLQVGEAIGVSLFQTREDAVAACEEARKLIKPSSPKYLAFHVERCLGLVSEKGGITDGKRCTHYKNALAIWKASPAPVDPNDEESAIDRAKFVRQMKEDVAAYCTPITPPKKLDPNAMVFAPRTGATLETMEGISYALPDGFGVRSFDPDSGVANLRNPTTNLGLRVERVALNDSMQSKEDYPQKEVTAGGTRWEWEYIEFIPGSGFYVLYGKVRLANAFIVLGASDEAKDSKTGISKEAGLALFRKIAETVRVTGPRKCIGGCGSGVLK